MRKRAEKIHVFLHLFDRHPAWSELKSQFLLICFMREYSSIVFPRHFTHLSRIIYFWIEVSSYKRQLKVNLLLKT